MRTIRGTNGCGGRRPAGRKRSTSMARAEHDRARISLCGWHCANLALFADRNSLSRLIGRWSGESKFLHLGAKDGAADIQSRSVKLHGTNMAVSLLRGQCTRFARVVRSEVGLNKWRQYEKTTGNNVFGSGVGKRSPGRIVPHAAMGTKAENRAGSTLG